jgi:hypothetical protein
VLTLARTRDLVRFFAFSASSATPRCLQRRLVDSIPPKWHNFYPAAAHLQLGIGRRGKTSTADCHALRWAVWQSIQLTYHSAMMLTSWHRQWLGNAWHVP